MPEISADDLAIDDKKNQVDHLLRRLSVACGSSALLPVPR